MNKPFTNCILGVNVAITNMEDITNLITDHIDELKGQFICLSNVHTTIMAYDDESYRKIQNTAFLALPDGSPLSFVQRFRGYKDASQVAGPDLMPSLWKATEGTEISHYFYGSSEETIAALRKGLETDYPNLKIAGMESPPYRALTPEEDEAAIKRINESGASVVWVGLGAPKQEKWMYEHRDKINALMLGVGAGFDFHAGTIKRAPVWVRKIYMEWLYRLFQDPKRLWKRYVQTNAKFLYLFMKNSLSVKNKLESDKKKLLIYAHYYYPDVASTGQILTELAEGLRDSFHITVICTVPSYTGKIEQYYRKHKYYYENINGINVLRIRVPEFRKNFAPSRVYNILSYFISAILATIRIEKQDYIYTISQPPILGGLLGVIGKMIKGGKFIYNIQDFNPEQTMAVKYAKSKFILDMMMKVDKYACRKADKVIVVGRDMVDTLKNRFSSEKEQKLLPAYCCINNWIDEKEIVPLPADDEQVVALKKEYGVDGKYVIMYSGNIGLYYDLKNIMKVIEHFKDNEEVAFLFAGAGSVLSDLKNYVKKHGLTNVHFAPYQEKSKLVYSLNMGDVHFVVNAKGIKGVSVPSKLYGVMAAGKPVLGILEEGTEARYIIEEAKCGLSVTPGDYEAIEKLIAHFIATRGSQEQKQMGQAGRGFLAQYLTKEISIEKYRQEIMEVE